MDYTFDFDALPGAVIVTTHGVATVAGFDTLMRALSAHDRFVHGMPHLVDHRDLMQANLTFADMHDIQSAVESYAEAIGAGCCAFVVADDYGYGTAKMYGALMRDRGVHLETETFYSIDEARDWLLARLGTAAAP